MAYNPKYSKYNNIPNYGMYTRAGDSRIHTLRKRLVKRALDGVPFSKIEEFFNSQMAKIEEKYPECWDAEVRDSLHACVSKDAPNHEWDLLR